jgi:hypothetical protein
VTAAELRRVDVYFPIFRGVSGIDSGVEQLYSTRSSDFRTQFKKAGLQQVILSRAVVPIRNRKPLTALYGAVDSHKSG